MREGMAPFDLWLLMSLLFRNCALAQAFAADKSPPGLSRGAASNGDGWVEHGSSGECGGGEAGAAALIDAARRITVKVGSSLLVDPSERRVREHWLASLGDDIAALRARGKQVVVVSSGAVALGRGHLGLQDIGAARPQAGGRGGGPGAADAGLGGGAVAPIGIPTAQLLLTIEDTERRRRWLNARATLEVLLAQGALPVINENDSVATDELRYGDNDRLSARVAQMIKSDVLILLSDVDGIYTADPAAIPSAGACRPSSTRSPPRSKAMPACGARPASASGGMRTKIAAARIASGVRLRDHHRLGPRGASGRSGWTRARKATVVAAQGLAGQRLQAVDRRHAGAGRHRCRSTRARRGRLPPARACLPAGVVSVSGRFERGACLRILDEQGAEVARGISRLRLERGAGDHRLRERAYREPARLWRARTS